jgi:hypothetical protein
LVELKPLIAMAAQLQLKGELPPAEVQGKITELINKLISLVEGENV